ncbi:hypothetical protein B0H66DRAFT_97654 [Apodospora peruviana]|uniref:Uncharacterized protein n=1 Tax=Apodospora peruviana TaxID=516989 RepID=A0AAE0IUC5_9PEZI|nr:hypothetical protein B0H66DRAFT_97654 [Apodospora peruviana]
MASHHLPIRLSNSSGIYRLERGGEVQMSLKNMADWTPWKSEYRETENAVLADPADPGSGRTASSNVYYRPTTTSATTAMLRSAEAQARELRLATLLIRIKDGLAATRLSGAQANGTSSGPADVDDLPVWTNWSVYDQAEKNLEIRELPGGVPTCQGLPGALSELVRNLVVGAACRAGLSYAPRSFCSGPHACLDVLGYHILGRCAIRTDFRESLSASTMLTCAVEFFSSLRMNQTSTTCFFFLLSQMADLFPGQTTIFPLSEPSLTCHYASSLPHAPVRGLSLAHTHKLHTIPSISP